MTSKLEDQLAFTLQKTSLPALGELYRGKVRDVYARQDTLVLVTTDRLSAFDHVLTTLPFKGDLLNSLSQYWFSLTKDLVPNHVLDFPDPCVTVGKKAQRIDVEFVVRGYLTGSLWRDYEKGLDPYELHLPKGLKRDHRFEQPLLTPSTKAELGSHDLPLSPKEVVSRGLMTERDWAAAAEAALALFQTGQKVLAQRDLLLVDTKYEFGKLGQQLIVIDELHTPDSSRFWYADTYAERFAQGEAQRMLDKENLRQWLIQERGFSGQGSPPTIPDEIRVMLADKYLTAYQAITGTPFALQVGNVNARLEQNLRRAKLL